MTAKTDPSFNPADVSLFEGGPSYRAQRAVGLIHHNQGNRGRQIAFLIAVGWLPLLLITLFSNPGAALSLLTEYRVYARMVIAVPVLMIGEFLMDSRFRTAFMHIRHAGILDAPDLEYMDSVIATLVRIRDSILPELTILVIVIVHTATGYKSQVNDMPWLAQGAGADLQLTAAGWYSILVSALIFQFLFVLSLWRWLLWAFFLFKLSRRDLKVVPTHPDGHGGLGFLGEPSSAFAPVALAATAVIGATWRHQILHQGAHLIDFKLPAIALVVIVALLALGPLVFFIYPLAALRRRGIREYGVLGQIVSADFHTKWISHGAGRQTELLQASDSAALNNFGQDYKRIEDLKPFPADIGSLYTLAAAIAIPALPTVLAEIPLAVVLKDLFDALR
jgi:hypothetical protein